MSNLERLLERAARVEIPAPEMPYGFDTRVVALAKEKRGASWQENGVKLLLRRVALAAVVVIAFSGSAAYWQMSENDDLAEPLSNVYAMADTAIDVDFFQ